jgi:thiamine transporter ThiT
VIVWGFPEVYGTTLNGSVEHISKYTMVVYLTSFSLIVVIQEHDTNRQGLITEMLEICIQASYDQNVQLILKSYLPVVYIYYSGYIQTHCQKNKNIKRADQILPEVYGTTLNGSVEHIRS